MINLCKLRVVIILIYIPKIYNTCIITVKKLTALHSFDAVIIRFQWCHAFSPYVEL